MLSRGGAAREPLPEIAFTSRRRSRRRVGLDRIIEERFNQLANFVGIDQTGYRVGEARCTIHFCWCEWWIRGIAGTIDELQHPNHFTIRPQWSRQERNCLKARTSIGL